MTTSRLPRDPLDTLGPAARALLAPDYPHLATPGTAAPAASPHPEHDPLVCGLYDELCPGCIASPRPRPSPPPGPHDLARARWEQLQNDHWRLLRGDGSVSSQMPRPLAGDQLRGLVATGLSPVTGPLLREALDDPGRELMTDAELGRLIRTLYRRPDVVVVLRRLLLEGAA